MPKSGAAVTNQNRIKSGRKVTNETAAAELAAMGIDGGKVPTLNASRTIYEAYRARTAQIEYEERVGLLVPVDKVRKEAFTMARITRDAMLAIPDRLASEIVGMTDQFTIHAKLSAEIKAALAEISRIAAE